MVFICFLLDLEHTFQFAPLSFGNKTPKAQEKKMTSRKRKQSSRVSFSPLPTGAFATELPCIVSQEPQPEEEDPTSVIEETQWYHSYSASMPQTLYVVLIHCLKIDSLVHGVMDFLPRIRGHINVTVDLAMPMERARLPSTCFVPTNHNQFVCNRKYVVVLLDVPPYYNVPLTVWRHDKDYLSGKEPTPETRFINHVQRDAEEVLWHMEIDDENILIIFHSYVRRNDDRWTWVMIIALDRDETIGEKLFNGSIEYQIRSKNDELQDPRWTCEALLHVYQHTSRTMFHFDLKRGWFGCPYSMQQQLHPPSDYQSLEPCSPNSHVMKRLGPSGTCLVQPQDSTICFLYNQDRRMYSFPQQWIFAMLNSLGELGFIEKATREDSVCRAWWVDVVSGTKRRWHLDPCLRNAFPVRVSEEGDFALFLHRRNRGMLWFVE